MFDVNEKLVFERTSMTLKDLYKKIIDKLDKLGKNYKILDWLWEVLDEKKKIICKKWINWWTKTNLNFKIKFLIQIILRISSKKIN